MRARPGRRAARPPSHFGRRSAPGAERPSPTSLDESFAQLAVGASRGDTPGRARASGSTPSWHSAAMPSSWAISKQLVAEHPLRERFHGQLMLALYRSGRQAEALGVYRLAREALVAEFGIEPTPALRDLERAILSQDPSSTSTARVQAGVVRRTPSEPFSSSRRPSIRSTRSSPSPSRSPRYRREVIVAAPALGRRAYRRRWR